jgi:AcrR family transcriptional regulator
VTPRAPDPRSLRTVAALRDALRGSLLDSPLDEVGVSELCRQADVRRTTFYTHYTSVAELLTEMLTTEIDERLEVSDMTGLSIAQVATEFHDTLVAAFELVLIDRHLFRVGFESDASAPLRRSLTAMFERRLSNALDVWQQHGAALGVDAPVASAFAAGGLAASIEFWAHSDDLDAACAAASVRDQMPLWWPRA